MRKILTLFAVLLTAQTLLAQPARIGKISGILQSSEGKSLEAATVTLLRARDSVLVRTAVSGKSGEFEFDKVPEGRFLVSVNLIGFSRYVSAPVEITAAQPTVSLPALVLQPKGNDLAEVSVSSRKPFVELQADKMVVNVESSPTNAGSTAMDILEKSPNVAVDRDGNISVKGKQGVIIMMDGKQTYLSATDLANLLRNTPASQLESIEIMTQPSAKFDASGNSGIINIKTKRQKTAGFNGSVSATYTQGLYPKTNTNISLNSRKGKWNVFGSYSFSYFEGFNDNYLTRVFRNATKDTVRSVFDQKSSVHFYGRPHNLRFGIDFFASKKTTLGIVLNGFYNVRSASVESRAKIFDGKNNLDSLNIATTHNQDPWKNLTANLNFRQLIGNKGQELTADLDYVQYNTRNMQESDNYITTPSGTVTGVPYLLRGNSPSEIKIRTAKADYLHPIDKTAKLEAGFKVSHIETDNDANFHYLDNGVPKPDARSNHFIYEENINAAYVNLSKQLDKKWYAQAGLRFEQTISKGNQLTSNSKFKRSYEQLFPTAYIGYKFNDNNQLTLSYGRRIDRPNYRDMNPFQQFLDKFTFMQGNPNLTPQFTHNIELGYNHRGALIVTTNYTRTTDIINDIIEQNDSTKVTFQTKKNIARSRNLGLALTFSKPMNKIWFLTFTANVYNNYYTGLVNNRQLSTDATAFSLNTNNQFRFKKGWTGELSGFFNSRNLVSGLIVARPMGMFSLGVSKTVMKNKGTIRLNVRDPFFLQQFRGYTRFDNIDLQIRSRNDSRQVSLNFTYRFGKNQNNIPQRRRTSASQEEQNRVGAGN